MTTPDSTLAEVAQRKPAIIVDLDGTLAVLSGRGPFEYARCGEDLVNPFVAMFLRVFNLQGYTVLIVTGRPETCQGLTMNWLSVNSVSFDYLFMRKEGDWRKDATLKTEIYKEAIEPNYDVQLCLDDRDSSVLAWRLLGLECWQVAPGDF